MELTDTQKQAVAKWAKEGAGLADIQKRLAQEFQITLTYMDVRFLMLDLGVDVKERPKRATVTQDLKAATAGGAPADPLGTAPDDVAEPDSAGLGGGVQVEMDRVTRPGAIVSGTVVFSDGVKATWALDQMGRLGLDVGGRKNYRPSEADVQAFQETLSRELQKHGY